MLRNVHRITFPSGNIQCYRLEIPENGKIIYANERGIISDTLEKYSMGTFAEIQCDDDLVVDGENFLSCTENTQWDYPLPNCVIKTTTTEDASDHHSPVNVYAPITDDNVSVEDSDELNVHEPPIAPTMAFWQSLKKFLYQGCHSLRNTSSELCWKLSKPIEFSDLASYQPPETNAPMDKMLEENLQRCVNNLSKFSFSQKLTFENMFDCITNWENPATMSNDEKDSLRLIICFYIDTVSLQTDHPTNSAVRPDESITDQIKRHLTRLVTAVFQNYLRDAAYDTFSEADDSTKTTEMTSESECNLMLIPTYPANTTIKSVTSPRATLSVDTDGIRMVPVFVSEMSKVHFACAKGYQLIGKDYTECLFGEWTDIGFDCERKLNGFEEKQKKNKIISQTLCFRNFLRIATTTDEHGLGCE